MNLGLRLKEERERLGYSQPAFAELVNSGKHAQIKWEKGETSPTALALEAWAGVGLDVLYVVTGQRQAALPAADPSEQLLLDNFRRSKLEAKQNLLQSSVLYAAGMPPAPEPKPAAAAKTRAVAGSMNMSNLGSGNVQIGSIGGDYNSEPKPTRKKAK